MRMTYGIPSPVSQTALSASKLPVYSSLQWWALPGQATDAARLTPSLAKVVFNARKDTTRFVLHVLVRFLRFVRSTVETYNHAHSLI